MINKLETLKKSLEDSRSRKEAIERQLSASIAVRESLLKRLSSEYNISSLNEARDHVQKLKEKEQILSSELSSKLVKIDELLREIEHA